MSLILGSLVWRLLMNKYHKDEFYKICSEFDITIKQCHGFLTSWNGIRANLNDRYFGNRWEHLDSRRSLTRIFYECLSNMPSGFITKAAHDILEDPLLDAREKTKLTTADHVMSGQAYGCFCIANYEELFEYNFRAWVKECITASTTVICTVEQNIRCKSFTINDKTTGGILRLRVPTESRYEAAGMYPLFDTVNDVKVRESAGDWIFNFPFELSDKFLDYQKTDLLI
jgi:hypothetical protein